MDIKYYKTIKNTTRNNLHINFFQNNSKNNNGNLNNSYEEKIIKKNHIRLCFGSLSNSTKTMAGKYAGVTIQKIDNIQNEENLKFKCISYFHKEDFLLFDEKQLSFQNQAITSDISNYNQSVNPTVKEEEICQELYAFQMFNSSKYNYESHLQNCYSMGGRMLTANESIWFTKIIWDLYNNSISNIGI